MFSKYTKSMMMSIVLLIITTQLHGWSGRVLPVAFNKASQEWNILLGHDINGFWSDFSRFGNKGERGDVVATSIIVSNKRLL